MDLVELAGLIFNAVSSVVGIVALYLAVKAYKVAEESYRVAKDQGRSAFELEVLRDLALRFDGNDFAERAAEKPNGPLFSGDIVARLAMIPRVELPLWRAMAAPRTLKGITSGRLPDWKKYADEHLRRVFSEKAPSVPEDAMHAFIEEHRWGLIAGQLHDEVRKAIQDRAG